MLRAFRLPLPTDTWARFLLVPALAFIATAIDRNYQTDFWHHLARGRAIVESGGLVDHDLFAFTVADRPFQDVNWLTQLFYYYLYQLGGLNLVQSVNSLTIALVMAGVVWLCWRACGSLVLASAVGVGEEKSVSDLFSPQQRWLRQTNATSSATTTGESSSSAFSRPDSQIAWNDSKG